MNKRRCRLINRFIQAVSVLSLIGFIIFGVYLIVSSPEDDDAAFADKTVPTATVMQTVENTTEPFKEPDPVIFYPILTEKSIELPEEYRSAYALIVNTGTNEIIAYREHDTVMYPASLTKVMSLIVAVEALDTDENLKDTVLITHSMIAPMIEQKASRAGFFEGETPTVRDLLYGMILPSGADASIALAEYTAGSEAAFVDMMNEKAKSMGLKNTHFTNPVGLHHEDHYSTAAEMAMILEYSLKLDICREVLETYQYTVAPNEINPDGILLTNTMFSRMTGEEMPGVAVKGGKTGFTNEAMHCLMSYADINGEIYVMVLAGGDSKWFTVYDTLSGFSVFCAGGEAYIPPK